MRSSSWKAMMLIVAVAAAAACGEAPIGQPCTFSWPRDADGNINCNDYPTCAPLQDTSKPLGVNNDACPQDCIQLPSLQCENLICVATQIPGNVSNMNGQCSEEITGSAECPDAPMGCTGYCSKECLSDASCPKGYSCVHMAPFGTNLNCEDEKDWDTSCTTSASCVKAGESPPDNPSIVCPTSDPDDPNRAFSVCDQGAYQQCCTCLCYRYCPLLEKKFCRRDTWDDTLFPNAKTNRGDCQQQQE